MILDLDDIQGNTLRGYNMARARHVLVGGGSAAGLAGLIGELVAPAAGGLRVTSAAPWHDKPASALNLGLTAAGLAALGVPPPMLQCFPEAFTQGAAARAAALGDTGAAAPGHWAFGAAPAEQLALSLYTDQHRHDVLEPLTRQLHERLARHGLRVLSQVDAEAFPHGEVHFGYRDGIANPRIEGAPGRAAPDRQPACPPGDFLLGRGYVNSFAGNWLGDLPPQIGDNGSFGVLRMIRQEVEAFEGLLQRVARRYRVDAEWVAAKLMGRWRNGVPLTLAPGATMPGPIARERLNDFDYVPDAAHPAYFDDAEGRRCPVGAHVRRLNPRGARVMGKPHTRRLIRRAMPYGPRWRPGQDGDGIERGLLGWFVCGDIPTQFEFLLQTWANADYATTGLRGTREPILGLQPPGGGRFVIRTDDGRDPMVIDDLPQLTVTRGCLYCFLPGLGALRFLASLGAR